MTKEPASGNGPGMSKIESAMNNRPGHIQAIDHIVYAKSIVRMINFACENHGGSGEEYDAIAVTSQVALDALDLAQVALETKA